MKTSFLSRKRANTTFLSRKFMITHSSIAFEDFLGSSIAPQVRPPWCSVIQALGQHSFCAVLGSTVFKACFARTEAKNSLDPEK